MATSAGFEALRLAGDLNFGAGGMAIDWLVGTFVKSVAADGTVVMQDSDGNEQTIQLVLHAGAAIPDDSLLPAKAKADTAVEKAAWRARLASAHVSAGTVLAPVATVNETDITVITTPVPGGISFVDVLDQTTELTAADAGDVLMVFTFRGNKTWTRVGNILTGSAALRARIAALEAGGALLDRKTADLDTVSDGPGYVEAPAAEAGIAIFAESTTVGGGLLDGSRPLEAGDLAGYGWSQAVALGAERQAVVVRIEGTKGPLDYALKVGGDYRRVESYHKVLSDQQWDYFYLGEASNVQLRIDKRGNVTHTRYGGELTGRALEQLQDQVGTQVTDDLSDAVSGSAHALIGEATLTLLQFGDGRGVWTKDEFLALRTIEPNGAYDPARAGGYGAGAAVNYDGVNYSIVNDSADPPGAFDPADWSRDADQPTPFFQYSILARLRNAAGLPSGDNDQWVMTLAQNPGHAAHSIQWLETSMLDSSKLELFQKDETGHWVEPAGDLVDGLVLFRFTLVDDPARQLFRNADNTRDVIRDNLHFLLGKATNIGNYRGLGIDVRITVQSQSVDPTTPRRLPHIPQPMLEGELIRLTEDDVPHPTSEQVYRFGAESSGYNPSYGNVFPDAPTVADGGRVYVFGVALAGTFGGVLDQYGPDDQYRAFGRYVPGVVRANGIRAIYVRSDHPSRIYVRMARALVADGEVGTLKFRYGVFVLPDRRVNWAYATVPLVPVAAETTADVRTFYCEPTSLTGNPFSPYSQIQGLAPDSQGLSAFSILKGEAAWLRYDEDTGQVRFDAGAMYAKGFYEGAGDGQPVRVYLPRNTAEAGLLIDAPANPIAATALNQDKVLYRAGRFYKAEAIHYADPAATYRDFATADLPAGYSWGGAVQVSPGAAGVPDGRIIYSIPGQHFLRKITGGGRAWWVQYTPPHWRGIVADESAADKTVRAVGDVVFFGGKVQVVDTYAARAPDAWHWVPIEKRSFEVTVGASGAAGNIPEGTRDLSLLLKDGTDYGDKRVLLSNLTAAVRVFGYRVGRQGEKQLDVSLSYAAGTRTLTYTVARDDGSGAPTIAVKALGEA